MRAPRPTSSDAPTARRREGHQDINLSARDAISQAARAQAGPIGLAPWLGRRFRASAPNPRSAIPVSTPPPHSWLSPVRTRATATPSIGLPGSDGARKLQWVVWAVRQVPEGAAVRCQHCHGRVRVHRQRVNECLTFPRPRRAHAWQRHEELPGRWRISGGSGAPDVDRSGHRLSARVPK